MRQALEVNFPGAFFEIKIVLAIALGGSGLKTWFRGLRIVHCSCVGCDPVNLPGFASVVREGLLEMARIRSDIRYDKSNEYGPVIQGFLVIKLAASIFELANRGLGQRASAAAGKIKAPLTRLRIVQAQVQTFDVPCGTVGFEFHQIRATVPKFADDGRPVILDPAIGTGEWMLQAAQMSLPSTDLEVEIVLAVAQWSLLTPDFRRV